MNDNIIYQDNKSSILLEKNGKGSSSKRTKHINIRYFFVTDRIAQGEVNVEWCPTGAMIGDFATKPLQGALFKKFRDLIMGVAPISSARAEIQKIVKDAFSNNGLAPQKEVPQECVGENTKTTKETKTRNHLSGSRAKGKSPEPPKTDELASSSFASLFSHSLPLI